MEYTIRVLCADAREAPVDGKREIIKEVGNIPELNKRNIVGITLDDHLIYRNRTT